MTLTLLLLYSSKEHRSGVVIEHDVKAVLVKMTNKFLLFIEFIKLEKMLLAIDKM